MINNKIENRIFNYLFNANKIPGRTFKIDVEYIPITKEKDFKASKASNKIDVGPYIRLMQQIDKKVSAGFLNIKITKSRILSSLLYALG